MAGFRASERGPRQHRVRDQPRQQRHGELDQVNTFQKFKYFLAATANIFARFSPGPLHHQQVVTCRATNYKLQANNVLEDHRVLDIFCE